MPGRIVPTSGVYLEHLPWLRGAFHVGYANLGTEGAPSESSDGRKVLCNYLNRHSISSFPSI
jgi:hypothetical protein